MFECHITCWVKDAPKAAEIAKELHWKTSEIARDPLLGDDTYFYLTSHDTDLTRMFIRMHTAVSTMRAKDIEVVREKIEVIIHDTKKRLIEKRVTEDDLPMSLRPPSRDVYREGKVNRDAED